MRTYMKRMEREKNKSDTNNNLVIAKKETNNTGSIQYCSNLQLLLYLMCVRKFPRFITFHFLFFLLPRTNIGKFRTRLLLAYTVYV